MDCYEVLRQVIDDAEHFPGLFLLAWPTRRCSATIRAARSASTPRCRCASGTMCARTGGDNPLAPLVRIAA